MKYYGIYKITNLVNGKMYIGKHVTSNIEDGYMGSSPRLRRSIKKYGLAIFRKEWLGFYEDEEELNYMERVFVDQTWVDRTDTYNLQLGGEGGWSYINSRPVSIETRLKLSKRFSGKGNPRFGKHLTDATKQKIRDSKKNISEETRLKISNANRGRKRTDEFKRLVSEKLKGRSFSDEHKSKISNALKGKNIWTKGTHWYNNGIVNIKTKECPQGFVKGRLLYKTKIEEKSE